MTTDPVATFISLVYPSASSWLALCLIPPDARQPQHRFTTANDLPRYLSYARYRNAGGCGIYITPSVMQENPANRRKPSFQDQQQIIYLDCDQPSCLEHIKSRYPYPTLVVRTSKGRYHVYWRLEQPVTVTAQEQLMSLMAIDVGADRAATDVSRVLRLPGFWNRKPSRNNTVDIVYSRRQLASYQSLLEKTQPTQARPTQSSSLPSTGEDASAVLVRTRLASTTTESERDWYEVHRRLALGHRPQDVVCWLEAKRIDKPDPRYYAQLTVSKAVRSRTN